MDRVFGPLGFELPLKGGDVAEVFADQRGIVEIVVVDDQLIAPRHVLLRSQEANL